MTELTINTCIECNDCDKWKLLLWQMQIWPGIKVTYLLNIDDDYHPPTITLQSSSYLNPNERIIKRNHPFPRNHQNDSLSNLRFIHSVWCVTDVRWTSYVVILRKTLFTDRWRTYHIESLGKIILRENERINDKFVNYRSNVWIITCLLRNIRIITYY